MTRQTPLQRTIPSVARRTGAVLCALIGLTAALSGCGRDARGGTAPEGLTQDEFVAVVVALREAERAVGDSLPDELTDDEARDDSAAVLFAERKREILEEHDTTEEEVRAFVLANGGDLRLLQETWGAIGDRLKYVRTAADMRGDAADHDPLEREGVLEKGAATEGEAVPSRPGAGMRIIPDRRDLEGIR